MLVTGDEACAVEARALVPAVEAVAVKAGIRRSSAAGLSADENRRFNLVAIHRHPEQAAALIRAGAERALRRRPTVPPFTLEPPYELVSVMRPTDGQPGRVSRTTGDDLIALLGWPPERAAEAGVRR